MQNHKAISLNFIPFDLLPQNTTMSSMRIPISYMQRVSNHGPNNGKKNKEEKCWPDLDLNGGPADYELS